MYVTPVRSEEDLIARDHGAIESLTIQLHLLGHVCETQHRRCRRLCNDVGGTQFVMQTARYAAHVEFIDDMWNGHFDTLQQGSHSSNLTSLDLLHSSFSNPSAALPRSQLILQPFRRFT